MKLSNFKYEGKDEIGTGYRKKTVVHATVDVATGFLWWKKVVNRKIGKTNVDWSFEDNGQYTPDYQAEELARAYEMRHSIVL